MIVRLYALLLLVLALTFFGTCVWAAEAPLEPPADSGLRSEGSLFLFDFGRVQVYDTPIVSRHFSFVNSSREPLDITGIRPTCDCLTVTFITPPSVPAKVLPGQTISFDAQLDLRKISSGSFGRAVLIYVDGSTTPAVQVVLTGNIVLAGSFSQTIINLGSVAPGTSQRRIVSATVDNSVLVNPSDLTAQSTLSTISVRETGEAAIDATRTHLDFSVQSTAPQTSGSFEGEIELTGKSASGEREELAEPLHVVGTVAESVHAVPQFLYVDGIGHTQAVALDGLGEKQLERTSIKCSSPAVWLKLAATGDKTTLLITQRKTVEPSNSLCEISVWMDSGQQITIPVHLVFAE